ncbi:MAG: heavy metal translocating P-type ATPase [Caldilineaceae bacterium]
MALLTSLLVAGGAVILGVTGHRPPNQLRLVDTLIDDAPWPASCLPMPEQSLLARVQQACYALLNDTRQQQQQTLAVDANYDNSSEAAAERLQQRNFLAATAGLGLATLGALLNPLFYWPAIGCVLYAARLYTYEGYRLLVEERRVDYRTVIALTVPAALAIGAVWLAAFGTVLYLVSFYLVAKTENRSKQSIVNLFGKQLRTVWLLVDDLEVETPVERVRPDDIVVVHAGQLIPVDGVITVGVATIDQQMLTGEAQPAEKGVGDRVLAATLLLTGRICVRVEQAGDATVVAQITHLLNQTTDFKVALASKTETWLNKMALPLLGLSALALPVGGLQSAVALLWYQPGARMVLFGPLSMLSYLQVAAQKRVLIKDGRALEVLQTIDTIVFDKTGTLTLEQPTVSRVFCYNGLVEDDLLRFAAAAESKQSHPIAHAIGTAAQSRQLEIPSLLDAEFKAGYGVKVTIPGHNDTMLTVAVGSLRFMDVSGIPVAPEIAAQHVASHAEGCSLVLVAANNEIAGAIELRPCVRQEAAAIVQALQQRGLETVIISGDHEAPTCRLATELGMDGYHAEVLPEEKAQLVAAMQQAGKRVCFIGDGINDAIALKTADVSISLRGATTIATDVAQIVFMDGSLQQLPALFTLADDFATDMRVNWLATAVPGLLGIAGTLLFGWGMATCVLLIQVSTPIGIYNALKPLLDEHKRQEKLLT